MMYDDGTRTVRIVLYCSASASFSVVLYDTVALPGYHTETLLKNKARGKARGRKGVGVEFARYKFIIN